MTAVLVGLAIAVGLAGTLLPILPGLPLIWLATLVYGLVEGFGAVGWGAMILNTALLIGGVGLGIRVPQRAAAAGGIGWDGQLLAVALAVAGFFVIPVVGAAIGFVGGVYLVARRRTKARAWETTKRTMKALMAAAAIQFGAGVAMALTWLVWVVLG